MTDLLAMLIIFVGSFVQSTIGFGLAIVTAPLLFMIDPGYVPAPITVVALILSIANTYRYRSSISFKGLTSAILGRIPGTIAGGLLLYWAEPRTLSLWLGITVLLGVAVSLTPIRLDPTPKRMAIAGFLSGFMGTSSSIGGPPMALLLQHENANLIRANLSAFFIVSCLMSLAVQAPAGYFSWHHFDLSLPLIPASLLGFWAASHWVDKIDKNHIRRISLVLCCLSGVAAIAAFWLN